MIKIISLPLIAGALMVFSYLEIKYVNDIFHSVQPLKIEKASSIVTNEKELLQAIEKVAPGDVIVLMDGEYKDVKLSLSTKSSKEYPIIIKAKNSGKVTVVGNFHWKISGDYITVSGIHFTKGSRHKDNDLIVDTGEYNTYQHCKFDFLNDVSGTYIKLEGRKSVVEYCEFTGKTTLASYINMDVPKEEGSHHIIRRNYFSRPPLKKNGGSAMRVGHGSMAMFHAYILIEENLFENCDGESEIVSVKSSRNYIRNNTFRTSKGAFSLRQGNGSVFEGNFFIGDGQKECGGLTIRGRDHFVFNNYFYNLKARKSGVINFGVASPEDPERVKRGIYPRHFPLTQDIVLCYNTIAENKSDSHINFLEGYGTRDRFGLPTNINFYNNIFDGTANVVNGKPNMKVTFASNFTSQSEANINGITSVKLNKLKVDGIVVPEIKSLDRTSVVDVPQQINYSVFNNRDLLIEKDIFGRAREKIKNAGCFNFTNTDDEIKRPLFKKDVGCGY
ncbi:polysaccharide lyase 6 family protein [Mariniflexile ostreae]|uniref:Polysaccharide lyase 6 family protein n=1 Tax=Mariniflexile ostreae TaxID=1520892 RepID=A0ABV5FF87_9FLAO